MYCSRFFSPLHEASTAPERVGETGGPSGHHGLVFASLPLLANRLRSLPVFGRALCVALVSLICTSAFAWSNDTTVNDVVCTATDGQEYPKLISDGSGGAIITWRDYRSGNFDIYAQRVDSTGAPQWTANGVAICTATDDQKFPQLISDGSGGAIITWQDYRSGTSNNIYARRVDSSGAPQWAADGVAICTATGGQYYPQLISDGLGGAIITWEDTRGATRDIYAQQINSTGAPQWAANGIAICTATNDQYSPQLISDGLGGAFITWEDYRGATGDIYAQQINSIGGPQWAANGIAICTAANDQYSPQLISDGSGGAFITWEDNRSGAADVYAQRVDTSSTVQWAVDGVAICTATDDQYSPRLISDGSGGAIITWEDYRSGDADVYAQRVDTSSTVQWAADGVAICTETGDQRAQQLISDGSAGAIITWADLRSGTYNDIYAQRVDSSGAMQWTADGVAICTAPYSQNSPQLISDDSAGAIITWHDRRSGTDNDIYAQHISSGGIVPVTLSAFSVE